MSLLKEAKAMNKNVLLLGNLLYEADFVHKTVGEYKAGPQLDSYGRAREGLINDAAEATDRDTTLGRVEAREVTLSYVKNKANPLGGMVLESNDLLVCAQLAFKTMMAPCEELDYMPSLAAERPVGRGGMDKLLAEETKLQIVGAAEPNQNITAHEEGSNFHQYPIAETYVGTRKRADKNLSKCFFRKVPKRVMVSPWS